MDRTIAHGPAVAAAAAARSACSPIPRRRPAAARPSGLSACRAAPPRISAAGRPVCVAHPRSAAPRQVDMKLGGGTVPMQQAGVLQRPACTHSDTGVACPGGAARAKTPHSGIRLAGDNLPAIVKAVLGKSFDPGRAPASASWPGGAECGGRGRTRRGPEPHPLGNFEHGGPRGPGPHGEPPGARGSLGAPPAPGEVPPLCPFCGGRGLPKKPGMGRLSGSSVSVGAASLRLVVDSKGEEYYKCHGCDMSFVFADREIGTMLPGMMVSLSVPIRIKHYYGGGVSARDLLTRHRTATVRKVRGRLSFFSSKTARNELVVCFNYNGVRTFGSFRRRRGDNGYYYTFEGLDRA